MLFHWLLKSDKQESCNFFHLTEFVTLTKILLLCLYAITLSFDCCCYSSPTSSNVWLRSRIVYTGVLNLKVTLFCNLTDNLSNTTVKVHKITLKHTTNILFRGVPHGIIYSRITCATRISGWEPLVKTVLGTWLQRFITNSVSRYTEVRKN